MARKQNAISNLKKNTNVPGTKAKAAAITRRDGNKVTSTNTIKPYLTGVKDTKASKSNAQRISNFEQKFDSSVRNSKGKVDFSKAEAYKPFHGKDTNSYNPVSNKVYDTKAQKEQLAKQKSKTYSQRTKAYK